jgi:dTDP-4-dehydrorhamnose 3,5-epimerase/CDP-3, 6-dideoxy-D-glycero-D-glycero-4-hexulose-5-epimerase
MELSQKHKMKIENTNISGLKIIHLDKITDTRGFFLKTFNQDFFKEQGLDFILKESYFTISQKNVIRGMHFQIPPFDHIKLVYLTQGKIIDVVLDLRKNSSTFGQYLSFKLESENPKLIYIPKGCAHGFGSLCNNSIVTYLQSTVYQPQCDKGIRYNSFGFNWKIMNPIISERDLSFEKFNEIEYF